MKILLALILSLFLSTLNIFCQTVVINNGMYGIDNEKKLIVINQELAQLNDSEVKTGLSINGNSYTFENQIENLQLGICYTVRDQQQNIFSLYFTELPIIQIETPNKIEKEIKVPASFSISDKNGEQMSSVVGIRYRGNYTYKMFDKKSYRIEFWTDEEKKETKDVSLLGLRSDDDWNLNAMPNEPLRARNKTNFDIWRKINTLYYQSEEKML